MSSEEDARAHTSRVYRNLDEVASLLRRPQPRGVSVRLDIPGLSDDDAQASAAKLSTLAAECGCGAGAVSALAALAIAVAWQWIDPPQGALQIAAHALAALALVVGAGGVGKLIARSRARRLMRDEIALLARRVAASV